MTTNRAPTCRWERILVADGLIRHRLYVDGKETPWFVDVATVAAHRSHGYRVALWASGKGPNGTAGFFGGFRTIQLARHRAELLAMS